MISTRCCVPCTARKPGRRIGQHLRVASDAGQYARSDGRGNRADERIVGTAQSGVPSNLAREGKCGVWEDAAIARQRAKMKTDHIVKGFLSISCAVCFPNPIRDSTADCSQSACHQNCPIQIVHQQSSLNAKPHSSLLHRLSPCQNCVVTQNVHFGGITCRAALTRWNWSSEKIRERTDKD